MSSLHPGQQQYILHTSPSKYKVKYNKPIQSTINKKKLSSYQNDMSGFSQFIEDIDYDYNTILTKKQERDLYAKGSM